jgi:hypothetical protein
LLVWLKISFVPFQFCASTISQAVLPQLLYHDS